MTKMKKTRKKRKERKRKKRSECGPEIWKKMKKEGGRKRKPSWRKTRS
jgi:hypothetical protein